LATPKARKLQLACHQVAKQSNTTSHKRGAGIENSRKLLGNLMSSYTENNPYTGEIVTPSKPRKKSLGVSPSTHSLKYIWSIIICRKPATIGGEGMKKSASAY